jgi:hypothetical protein
MLDKDLRKGIFHWFKAKVQLRSTFSQREYQPILILKLSFNIEANPSAFVILLW